MAFTVEDFHDLIELLAQRPEWRAELRRHVLSDELLELPALIRQLVEAQARAESRLDRLESTVQALVEAQAHTDQAVAQLVAAQAQVVAQLKSLDDRLGTVEGANMELRYERRGLAYLSDLAYRLRPIDTGRLAEMLDDLLADGRLTRAQRSAILLADVVFSGRRYDDGHDIYVLVEVSNGVGLYDVERAVERSAFLEKAGRPVIPVVAGRRIAPEAANMAYEHGVWYAEEGRLTAPRSA